MSLSDLAIRNAKPTGKPYTLPDTDNLSLAVSPKGGKCWHFRYYWNNKQKRMSLGQYPTVSLAAARSRRDECNRLLSQGVNPRIDRKKKRHDVKLASDHTFEAIYQQWLAHRSLSLEEGRQTSLGQIRRMFKKEVLPYLRTYTVFDITRSHLLEVIGRIEKRDALSMAEKLRTWLRQLFEYATVAVPKFEINPAASLHVVALPLPPVEHNPFLRFPQLPEFLQTLRKYPGELPTQLAVRLLFLTAVRTGELRQATPDQFDLEEGVWRIPVTEVKQLKLFMRKKRRRPSDIPDYIVPLSVQAIEIVRHLISQMQPAQRYLFAGAKCLKERISENTVNVAIQRIGYGELLTGHGIRGTISTALHEFGYPAPWVDAQLSHVDPNAVRGSYNHAKYVEQRRVMMQDWADRLDLLEQGQLESASTCLTIQIVGVPTMGGTQSGEPPVGKPGSPVLVLTHPAMQNREVPASVQRLSAVTGPKAPSNPSKAHLERINLIEMYESPHNIKVIDFAKLVGKSRRMVSYDICDGKVLALSMGNRGLRVPDWHLDPLKNGLIASILQKSRGIDAWTVYLALVKPLLAFSGHSAIEAVTPRNLDAIKAAVTAELRAQRCELAA